MKSINALFSIIAVCLFLGMTGSSIAQGGKKDLESKVETALSPYYMHELFVSADDSGAVVIRGKVDALYDKLDMYQLVSQVNGVTEISDLVEVVVPTLPDDIIKVNIERTINDNSVILEPDKITVVVHDGFVFLSGTVSYYKEKLMATTVSSWQDGVKGVENEINVLPSPVARSDENIKVVLSEIIKNHFPLVDNTVSIKIVNGDIAVGGEVGNYWEKDHIKEEFLQVIGVKSVVENLEVKPR